LTSLHDPEIAHQHVSVDEGSERRVAALVLSHNAPQSLARCLEAIAAQTNPPQGIVVVDNASDPAIEIDALPPTGLPIRIIRSDINSGPAGGWAMALRDFLSGDFTDAWIMDDDIVPEAECLATLLMARDEDPGRTFVVPISIQPDGAVGRWGSWCGFMIAREIVEAVGLPRAELFWWAEDTEYCHWRIPQAGYERRVIEEAVVHHDAIRQDGGVPLWKYYYEARNMLYYHLHIMHKVGRYPRNVSKLLGRAIFRPQNDRLKCLWAIARGLFDGAFGRLGIRYPVSSMRERDLSPG
jgi:rhamnopyranosyl-N-acetylglucosaminyl-diphospho-decaprenol beta-1,3/1,4-galactofuranosyltransferase